jgi:hypothetical protein
MGGFAGGVGGMLFAAGLPGYIVGHFGYVPMFAWMGNLHLIALGAMSQLSWHNWTGAEVAAQE